MELAIDGAEWYARHIRQATKRNALHNHRRTHPRYRRVEREINDEDDFDINYKYVERGSTI